MKLITGNARHQAQIVCLDTYIHQNNDVRFIDLFVDALPLADFGFSIEVNITGIYNN